MKPFQQELFVGNLCHPSLEWDDPAQSAVSILLCQKFRCKSTNTGNLQKYLRRIITRLGETTDPETAVECFARLNDELKD
jgi:hypothetical protein